jgi:phosphoglycolate phosphatase-like HAD superfamily hydrolase
VKLLALDFDGVISDSAPESFVVALRTYAELVPDTPLRKRAAHLDDAPGGAAPPLEAIVGDLLYLGFLEHMPLGNRAEDFAVALRALEQGVALADQAAYDAFRAQQGADWLRSYHRRFYELRSALAEGDPTGWHRLLGPYPTFLDVLRRSAERTQLAIVTAKDRRSVRTLLRRYGIDDLFADDRVLDKETGANKAAHLESLHRSTGTVYPEITFIDDKVNHLDSVAALGVSCGLAAWGYNGPREIALARQRGYLVLELHDVEEWLFPRINSQV